MTTSRLPDATYVERVLATLERYPFGTLSVILLAAVIAFGIHAWNRR